MDISIISDFKDRKIKAKKIFDIKEISKNEAYEFVRKYHYLGDAKFFCIQAFGLFTKDNELVGCATYSLPQGTATLKSWFSLDNQTKNIYELSRLCMLPQLNGTNATSYLLGNSIKELKKQGVCRAIITLADSTKHVGSIYQVCNFKYYGLTKKASDFYRIDGRVNPRGKSSTFQGVYLPRSRKHRYAYILDPDLKCNYDEVPKPSLDEVFTLPCCNGTGQVYDKRYDKTYTCPRCNEEFKEIVK